MKISGILLFEMFLENKILKAKIASVVAAIFLFGCSERMSTQESKNDCGSKIVETESIPSSLPNEFRNIKYVVEVYSVGENGKCVRHIKKSPEHAANFANGILLGGNRGEWGGELIFRDRKGKDRKILNENIISITVSSKEAFVLTGLSHLGSNFGALYALPSNENFGVGLPSLVAKFDKPPEALEFNDDLGFRIAFRSPKVSVNTLYVCYSPLSNGKSREIPCDERWGKKKAF